MQTRFRIYFYDAGTRQQFDTDLNGAEYHWLGASTGRRDERSEIGIKRGRQYKYVTSADFAGRTVRCKLWHPESVEWCSLIPGPTEAHPARRQWHVPKNQYDITRHPDDISREALGAAA